MVIGRFRPLVNAAHGWCQRHKQRYQLWYAGMKCPECKHDALMREGDRE